MIPTKYIYEYLFPSKKEKECINDFYLNKYRIKSTKFNNRLFLRNNHCKNSISFIDEYEANIPNKLKKYLYEKPLDKIYINKLSVLLNSNDKNYKLKRPYINELSCVLDENNKEYLDGLKFKNYNSLNEKVNKNGNEKDSFKIKNYKINQKAHILKKSMSDIINENKGLENNKFCEKIPFLQNIEYYRTPKVIINNEKIMLNFNKKKKTLIDKIPYLSRSRNDLIIYDYKKNKYKTNESNRIINNNNYLQNFLQMSERRRIYLNKIKKNNTKNRKYYLKFSSFPSIIRNKYQIKNNQLNYIKNNSQSMIIKENKKSDFIIPSNDKKIFSESFENSINIKNNYQEKYKIIERLSNSDLLKKVLNSIQTSCSNGKVLFSYDNKIRNSNKIPLYFGKNKLYDSLLKECK